MADKTFGVKVTDELFDRVKIMIESSGISAKEWFEKAVSLTEMNAIKQGATDYSQDLSELEVHTTRIYELISNLIQRSIYIKDHAIKEYADKLEQKEAIINEYQNKATTATEEAKVSKQLAEELDKEKEDTVKQLADLRSTNLNNQLLIGEYKEKNDTLSGLVSKYQSFAEENEQLKDAFSKEREQLQNQIKEITTQTHNKQKEMNELKQQLEMVKNNHKMELERLVEKKEYEKDKAVLETERDFQDKLLKANNEYNGKIKELYDEINSLQKMHYDEISGVQKEYEERIKKLEAELKSVKDKKDQDK